MVVLIRELVAEIKRIDSFVKHFRGRIYIDCMRRMREERIKSYSQISDF